MHDLFVVTNVPPIASTEFFLFVSVHVQVISGWPFKSKYCFFLNESKTMKKIPQDKLINTVVGNLYMTSTIVQHLFTATQYATYVNTLSRDATVHTAQNQDWALHDITNSIIASNSTLFLWLAQNQSRGSLPFQVEYRGNTAIHYLYSSSKCENSRLHT